MNINLRQIDDTIHCNIVYYGPPLAGKSTSIRYTNVALPERQDKHWEDIYVPMLRLHIVHCDFLYKEGARIIGDYKLRLHLYSGSANSPCDTSLQVSLLLDADGIIFVADSQWSKREENKSYFNEMIKGLESQNKEIGKIPVIMQYNKQDMEMHLSVAQMDGYLNSAFKFPSYGSIASIGQGVFDVHEAITAMIIANMKEYYAVV